MVSQTPQNMPSLAKFSLFKLYRYNLSTHEKKIVSLAALGGMLEFYDFIIYGIFSVYFANQFFPSGNVFISIIESYVVFILGYVARPIGGIIFSHIGDEKGRKKVLIITIILMGVSSLGIGVLPTYNKIGIAAPILLLILRLTQGLALGGELPSTYVYISESMPNKLGSGFGGTMTGVNSGLLLGMLINHLLNAIYTNQEIIHYAWRFPFIIGGTLCLISYKIRKTLQETKEFKQIADKPLLPIFYLFKHHLPQVLAGVSITATMASTVVLAIIFMPTYLGKIVKLDQNIFTHLMTLTMITNVVTIFLTGGLANMISPKKIFLTSIYIAIPMIAICYYLIAHQIWLNFALITLGIIEGIAATLAPLLIASLFPAKVRLTGVAICYNIGFTIFAGLAPIIITSFVGLGYNAYIIPVVYLWIALILSLFGILYTKHTLNLE